jgi:beta-lactamase superfamily II metal-dependent hydrolase
VRDLKCDLLKVPHHGSKTSSSDAFLSETRPEVAVVTCGKGNRYGHPAPEVLARFKDRAIRVCRTDLDGAIVVRVTDERLDTVRWNDMILERIYLSNRAAWGMRERTNGSRLLLSATAL